MMKNKRIDVVNIILNEIKDNKNLEKEKLYMQMHDSLCNEVLYTSSKYKESTIILTHIFNNLMNDFVKEVYDCVNNEGAYSHE